MTNSFGKYIINLLKEHECVVLPGIGGLLLKNVPAHISNNSIYPASKIIHFNKNILADDDLLVSELINKKKITYLESKLQVNKFVNSIKYDLAQKGFFDINNIGRFNLSENNDLKFITNANIENLDKDNFGLKNINVFTVQRVIINDSYSETNDEHLVEEEVTIKNKVHEIPKTFDISKFKPATAGLAAILVLMFGIFSLIFSNTKVNSLKVENANVLNFLVPKKIEFQKHYGTVIPFEISQQENGKKRKKKKKKKSNNNVIIIDDVEEEIDKNAENFSSKTNKSKSSLVFKDKKIPGFENYKSAETEKREAEEKANSLLEVVKEEIPKSKFEEKDKSAELNKNIEVKKIAIKKTDRDLGILSNSLLKNALSVNDEDNPSGYYIVVGAFGSLSNANKAKYNCSIDNTCKLFKTKNGMYRVAIHTTTDPETAVEMLLEHKKTNSSHWLMLNK